jgi:hypothetical protein
VALCSQSDRRRKTVADENPKQCQVCRRTDDVATYEARSTSGFHLVLHFCPTHEVLYLRRTAGVLADLMLRFESLLKDERG